MHELSIVVNKPTGGLMGNDFRKTILALTDSLPKEQKEKINLHYTDEQMHQIETRKMPYIIYAKPQGKNFKLFGYGDVGLELLQAIRKEIRFELGVSGKDFVVQKIYLNTLNSMPKKLILGDSHEYTLNTPLVLFTGGVRRWLDWQLINLEKGDERDTVLKDKVNSMIRDNLKHQLSTNIKYKDWDNLNDLELKWSDFKLLKIDLRGKKEYGIYGTFTSNYELPRFIGRKTGTGHGELYHLNKKITIDDIKKKARRKEVA